MTDILLRIADLHRQATTEQSHYYTAAVLVDAAAEIVRLRKALCALRDAVNAALEGAP